MIAVVGNECFLANGETMMTWSRDGRVTVTADERGSLLSDLHHRLQVGIGFSVATLNLDHVVKLKRDPVFCRAYGEQTHITADGNPIVWLSRLAGQPVSLIPGSELIDPLARVAAETGAPVALFGTTDASLEKAAAALRQRHRDVRIVLTLAPPMGFDPDSDAADAAISKIGASGARLVFLALGAPKQEVFAARAQKSLPTVGFVSIGAGLDFISGDQKRAPKWVRAIAAEWLWRMLGSPRRLAARYGACLAALPGLTVRAALSRGRSV